MPFELYTIKESELYGSEMPETEEDFQQILDVGIKVIVSLDADIREYKMYEELKKEFEHHELFITDFEIPSDEQVEEFLGILTQAKKENKPLLVHCLAGCGRTGLMLAMAERFIYQTKNGDEAIRAIREIRPCAVETTKQFDYIVNYKRKT